MNAIKTDKFELIPGKNYILVIGGKPFPFVAEDGSVMSGEIINGNMLDGSLMCNADNIAYEGKFSDPTTGF